MVRALDLKSGGHGFKLGFLSLLCLVDDIFVSFSLSCMPVKLSTLTTINNILNNFFIRHFF